MKKLISFLAVLLLTVMAAKAQTQPINVVCDVFTKTFYAADNDLYFSMGNSDYTFDFDIYCAAGTTDIVDGQTYTLTDMYQKYCKGKINSTDQDIIYSSVSFVRGSDGVYTANVTSTTGDQYNITYVSVPLITEPTDTVVVMMNNEEMENRVEDYTWYKDFGYPGFFQLFGNSDDNNYSMVVTFISDSIVGSYTMEDADFSANNTVLYSNAGGEQTRISCNNLLTATVTDTLGKYNAHLEWVANDGTMYDIHFTTAWPAPDTVNITMNNESNRVYDNTKHEGSFDLSGMDQNNEYIMEVTIHSSQIAGSYTKDNISGYLFQNDGFGNFFAMDIVDINDVTVTGDAQNCSTVVEFLSSSNIIYRVDFTYIYVAPDPIDTIDITMDNAAVNNVYDETYNNGSFILHGADQNQEYVLDLGVYSDQIAGSYAQEDIYGCNFEHNGNSIGINEISDFTVTGDEEQGYNTYVEFVGSDTILYRINYSYVVPAITDTIDITMENTSVYDYTAMSNTFQLCGKDQNNEYELYLAVNSDKIAGSYTKRDIDYNNSILAHNTDSYGYDFINLSRVRDFIVTGNTLGCSTHIEFVGSDNKLYRINYTYTTVAPETTDTIDITMDNAEVNIVENYISREGWFRLVGADQNQQYGLYFAVYSDQIAGNYTQGDINTTYSAVIDLSKEEPEAFQILAVNDFTVTGDAENCSAYIELVGSDEKFYRINYTYTYVAPVPTDSVEITMDNAEFNQVMADGEMFGLLGADENEEYVMQLVVYSDQIAGNYTKWDVIMENSGLYHLTANDTTQIEIVEVRDFTVTGDATNCSAYIEMVSADLVLYKITFTYATEPEAVETANETEFVVCSEGNAIMVYSEGEQDITVFDMAGRMITCRQNASDIERIEIAVPGIYVVRVGEKAAKAVVK